MEAATPNLARARLFSLWPIILWGLRQPLLFFAFYALAIPTFALVDTIIARHGDAYYAPYQRLERTYKPLENQVGTELAAALKRQYDAQAESSDRVVVSSIELVPRSASVNGTQLNIGFSYGLYSRGDPLNTKHRTVMLHLPGIRNDGDFPEWLAIPEYLLDDTDEDKLAVSRSLVLGETGSTKIVLSSEVSNDVDKFLAVSQGYQVGIFDTFWRMLYFSIVTITTLGYGDVVPTTAASRFSAGLEAIIGIGLAGLFINAAALRAADASRRRD